MTSKTVHLLDYVAGNVRSLVNAIEKVGFTVVWIKDPKDFQSAEVNTSIHSNSLESFCNLNLREERLALSLFLSKCPVWMKYD